MAHAGPSLPLEYPSLGPWERVRKSTFLSSSWSTAPALTATTAAMADGHPLPSSTSLPRVLLQEASTPTSPRTSNVRRRAAHSRSLVRTATQAATVSPVASTPSLSLSLLTLPSGAAIKVVSSATVGHPSTTLCSLSVSLAATGRSRTPGELAGEKADSSDWLRATPAASVPTLVLYPSDTIHHHLIEFNTIIKARKEILKQTTVSQ